MTGPISAKNKRIAFVSNSAWSVYNFRLDVIRHLLGLGYAVTVIAAIDEYAERLTREGCGVVQIEFNNRTKNPVSDYLFYRKLRRLYRHIQPDFIFHYVAKPNIYGSMAASAEGIPSVAVVTGLGYPFAKRNLLFRIICMLYKRALRRVHEVWFLNNEDAKVFVGERIVDIGKVKILPGEGINTGYFSLDAVCGSRAQRANHPPSSLRSEDSLQQETRAPEEIHPAQGIYLPLAGVPERNTELQPNVDCREGEGGRSFNFLMSTRLLKSKGISLYIDAARILKKKHYNVRFSLLGFFEKNHPDSISQDDLAGWQKEDLIRYYGFADDVRPFLANADCFVFPSFYNEGVPRCLMEAASMELPIITSLNRGCKEVVLNNSNGFIVNIHDPFDLADKMEKMLQLSEDDRKRMGKNGRQLVLKKFAIAKIVQEYANTLISAFEAPR